MSAAERVHDSVKARNEVLMDTMPMATRSVQDLLPKEVIAVTRHCIEKYTPAQIPAAQTFLAQELFLMAGRDADAAAVIQHRLSSLSATDTVARASILDTAARNLLTATPKRFAAAREIVDEITGYGATYPWYKRTGLYFMLMEAAELAKMDSLMMYYGTMLLSTLEEPSEEERNAHGGAQISVALLAISLKMNRVALLDSLRKSTDAYVAGVTAPIIKIMGRPDPNWAIGKLAPTLKGDFWYPDSASNASYPRRGKVTVVYFTQVSSPTSYKQDLGRQAVIRRLAHRYPKMDIVHVVGTVGYFGPLEPPDPRKESQYIDTLFRSFQRLPGVVSVSISPFIQLPEPDGRRVLQKIENVESYQGIENQEHRRFNTLINRMFLIDRDGRIILTLPLNPGEEAFVSDLIGALYAQHTHSTNRQAAR